MVFRLKDMSGLDVFTEEGMRVGTLDDISINPENGKVLGIVLSKAEDEFLKKMGIEGSPGIIVPYGAIKSIGDIVLIGKVVYGRQED